MRTALALDDDLLAKAEALTGVSEKTALVREALKVLIEREAARLLACLGGSDVAPIGPKAERRHRSWRSYVANASASEPKTALIVGCIHVRMGRFLRTKAWWPAKTIRPPFVTNCARGD